MPQSTATHSCCVSQGANALTLHQCVSQRRGVPPDGCYKAGLPGAVAQGDAWGPECRPQYVGTALQSMALRGHFTAATQGLHRQRVQGLNTSIAAQSCAYTTAYTTG